MTRYIVIVLLLVLVGCQPDEQPAAPPAGHCVSRTGNNATVVLPDSLAGKITADTLRAYGQAGCVGKAAIPDSGGMSLTAWGDDTMTDQLDGLLKGERFVLVGEDTLAVALQEQIPTWLDLLEYHPNAIYVLR